jgi:DNA processing protein
LETCGSLPNEDAAIASLKSHSGLSQAEKNRVESASIDAVESHIRSGGSLLIGSDLPERLPNLLPTVAGVFAFGNTDALKAPSVAIVGTRGASTYGKACAIKFAESIASAGAAIISGGAFGIDAAAHKGALDAGGQTICVLPCGVDQNYPASHRDLFKQIRTKGCMLSQFACGFRARSDSFLIRNMLIAALADVLLVVEAPEKSGALFTANRAADMGKNVYVVPGNISQTTFQGSHHLIRNGAILVDHPDQILEDLNLQRSPDRVDDSSLNDMQKRIVSVLGAEAIAVERIAGTLGVEPSIVLSELTMLELEGKVLRSSGGISLAP